MSTTKRVALGIAVLFAAGCAAPPASPSVAPATSPAVAASSSPTSAPAPAIAPIHAGSFTWTAVDAPNTRVPGVTWWLEGKSSEGGTVTAAVFRPNGDGPFPAVVYLTSNDGMTAMQLELGPALSDAGFMVVIGCYLNVRAVVTCRQPPADPTGAMIDLAKLLPGARSGPIGLVGCSLGGPQAFFTAARRDDVAAVVGDSPAGATSDMPNSPVLLLVSDLDNATLVANAHSYEQLLRQRGASVESKYYENGGHMTLFQDATRQDARQRAIAFLRTNLKP